jgi:division protein CdvB (Snf7/Vps24/ESCRT-III family)
VKVAPALDKSNNHRTLSLSREALQELQQQSLRYEQSCGKLVFREKELFGMIREALLGKDNVRANMYANELARVRHLKRVFSQSQLALECISIRVESLLDLYNAIQLDPVSDAIKEVVQDIQGISPEFTAGLEQLTKLASDTLSQATIGFKEPVLEEGFTASSPESLAILKEVSSSIEDSLKQAFPEPPQSAAPVASRQLEELSFGYERTFVPTKATAIDVNDPERISDEFSTIIEGFTMKGKLEESKN